VPDSYDAKLVRRAQAGDRHAIGELYDLYNERIFRYVWSRVSHREQAEDLTGEVFTRMVGKLGDYSPQGVPFQAWLYRIAHNLAIGHYRKEGGRVVVSLDHAEGLHGEGCVTITAVVIGVGADWMELLDGSVIDLTGVPVEGDLRVGSVVLMQVCVDAEGNTAVHGVVVIYQPAPEVPPAPPPAERQEEKVTVCHKPNGKNPHSITIARSALPAHLAHGDKLGPCE
jgi:RNA polymerase sigma factor (sigma-70 family)